jgi:hypothetical protein
VQHLPPNLNVGANEVRGCEKMKEVKWWLKKLSAVLLPVQTFKQRLKLVHLMALYNPPYYEERMKLRMACKKALNETPFYSSSRGRKKFNFF